MSVIDRVRARVVVDEKYAPRVVCTQGHHDRLECCRCCAWGTDSGYACCNLPLGAGDFA